MITCLLAESRQAVEGCQQFVQCLLQLEVEFLIGIQTQNPITGCLVDSGVFLRSVALPLLDEDFRAERLRDRHRAVRRARVDDDDFSLAVGDERLHAGECAAEVGFFVKSNNDDGKVHKWNAAILIREFVRGLEIVSHTVAKARRRWRANAALKGRSSTSLPTAETRSGSATPVRWDGGSGRAETRSNKPQGRSAPFPRKATPQAASGAAHVPVPREPVQTLPGT